jgi:hypothetical protein
MSRLVINLATRGRPQLLARTIRTTLHNIARADTVLMVSIDADDHETLEALGNPRNGDKLAPFPLIRTVMVSVESRELSLGAKYNRMLTFLPGADVYMAMVDYAPIVTPGFDEAILEAAAGWVDGIGTVFNDLANFAFPGLNAATRRWCELVGYFYPPYFPFWFIDHWFGDLADMTQRIAYAPVKIDTSRRPGTQNKRDLLFWCEFYGRAAPIREAIASRIIGNGEFRTPEWLKRSLLQQFPLVRQRSEFLNHIAMIEHGFGAEVPDDDRHRELRRQASELLVQHGLEAMAA